MSEKGEEQPPEPQVENVENIEEPVERAEGDMEMDGDMEGEMDPMDCSDGPPADEEEAEMEPEEEEVEEEEIIGPLVVSEKHENFTLDKIQETDETLGLVNDRTILCKYFDIPILPPGTAVKVKHEVSLQHFLTEMLRSDQFTKQHGA